MPQLIWYDRICSSLFLTFALHADDRHVIFHTRQTGQQQAYRQRYCRYNSDGEIPEIIFPKNIPERFLWVSNHLFGVYPLIKLVVGDDSQFKACLFQGFVLFLGFFCNLCRLFITDMWI